MANLKDELEKKIETAKTSLADLDKERERLEITIAPFQARIAKVTSDSDYWRRRIEKLTKRLAELQEIENG